MLMPRVGEELAGYRLRSVLGRGGMSVVYEAEYLRLGNTVALKILSSELASDDVFRTRFLQESRTAASLNHPNVIPIFDSGPCGELLYISMRYVAGADLRNVLKAHSRLAPDQAVLLVGQAGRALDAAHRAGLVHRDVKPANMLIERGVDDDPDHVYLADFGISKHALSKSGLTATGQFVGTLDYIAPEQIQGKPVSAATDIYSLGCVLYECLTGHPPFQKEVDAAVIWAHVEEDPPPASSVCRDLPPAVDDVLARALAKQPTDRYRTCREFVAAVQAALGPSIVELRSHGRSEPQTVLDTAVVAPAVPETTPGQPAARARAAADRELAPASPPSTDSELTTAAPAPQRPSSDAAGAEPATSRSRPARRYLPWGVAAAAVAALIVALVAGGGGSNAHANSTANRSTPTATKRQRGAAMSSSSSTSTAGMTKSSAMPKATAAKSKNPIMQAINVANTTSPSGYIPPSTCMPRSATDVVCNQVHAGATQVVIQTFPTLKALYAAYEARFTQLVGSPFRQNFQDCSADSTYGEVSWNHNYQHLRTYSVQELESGMVNDNLADGRVFCSIRDGDLLYIVWTENGGRMLGEVYGSPHEDTWVWWHDVHHELAIGPNAMRMQ